MKLFIVGFIIVALIFQRVLKRPWACPSSIYLYWSAFLIIGGLIAYPDYNWKGEGISWWIFSCVVFSIGISLVGKSRAISIKFTYPNLFKRITCERLLWAYFIIGLFYSVLMLKNNNFSLSSIGGMEDIYAINNYMQSGRYGHDDLHESVIQQICLSFTYGLPVSVGYLLGKRGFGKIKYLCICCLIPNLLITSLNNTKAGVIFAVMLFGIGYLISYQEEHSVAPKLTGRFLRVTLLLVIAFLAVMILAILLRYNGGDSRVTFSIISKIFVDYLFGGTLNFDHYFDIFNRPNQTLTFDYLEDSNIVTANSDWIYVYGYFGALLVWFFRGIICGIMYNRLKTVKCYPYELTLLVFYYLNVLYFFIWTPFSYTTVTVGVFLLFPYFVSKYRYEYIINKK